MLETIQLPHMPLDLPLYAALYMDVKNTANLKEQLLAGNSEFEYAFIDASMVLSRRHTLAAAFRAMNDYLHGRLKSHNIHSEIVFALSPNNNIGEAFRKFGIGNTTKHLVVFKVATTSDITAESVNRHLSENVQGTQVVLEDDQIISFSDMAKIRKTYKVPAADSKSGSGRKAVNGDSKPAVVVDERAELESQILGMMALRGAT